MHIPKTSSVNPSNCRAWNTCQPTRSETDQMTNVRIESRTILVVADISLVTESPAKLKNAMEKIVVQKAINKRGLWPS